MVTNGTHAPAPSLPSLARELDAELAPARKGGAPTAPVPAGFPRHGELSPSSVARVLGVSSRVLRLAAVWSFLSLSGSDQAKVLSRYYEQEVAERLDADDRSLRESSSDEE